MSEERSGEQATLEHYEDGAGTIIVGADAVLDLGAPDREIPRQEGLVGPEIVKSTLQDEIHLRTLVPV